jgi:hypothetical protein
VCYDFLTASRDRATRACGVEPCAVAMRRKHATISSNRGSDTVASSGGVCGRNAEVEEEEEEEEEEDEGDGTGECDDGDESGRMSESTAAA